MDVCQNGKLDLLSPSGKKASDNSIGSHSNEDFGGV